MLPPPGMAPPVPHHVGNTYSDDADNNGAPMPIPPPPPPPPGMMPPMPPGMMMPREFTSIINAIVNYSSFIVSNATLLLLSFIIIGPLLFSLIQLA